MSRLFGENSVTARTGRPPQQWVFLPVNQPDRPDQGCVASASDHAEAQAYCVHEVRAGDPDRFFAALLAPSGVRDDLFALYAFHLEIAKTAELVSEPTLGLIRLQWWREALASRARGHPVAARMTDLLDQGLVAENALIGLIDAREADLEERPFADLDALDAYADATGAGLMRIAAGLLLAAQGGIWLEAAERTVQQAGRAWALTGLLRALAFRAARRHAVLPDGLFADPEAETERLFAGKTSPGIQAAIETVRRRAEAADTAARAGWGTVPAAARPALAYARLCRPYLRALARPGHDPLTAGPDLPVYGKIARLIWPGY